MVRKILILAALIAFFPTTGWAVEDICKSQNDSTRYEEDDYDCLVQYREAFLDLKTLLGQTRVDWAQPPDNIVTSELVNSDINVQSIGFAQPPDNIDFRTIFFNPFFAQPPDN